MKFLLGISLFLAIGGVKAQSVASDSTKPKPTNALSKYQQPSRFGVSQPTAITAAKSIQIDYPRPKSRITSEYKYDKGRIVGGQSNVKFGKKKS